jgi:hypothetical protein
MNGLELVFQPDFGEVQVDQLLDVAKLYKQGMQVNLNTAFAEATLENLLVAIAGKADRPRYRRCFWRHHNEPVRR